MKWLLKAFIQRIIGLLPGSEKLNYFFQKRISKNLPVSDATLNEKIELGARRVALYTKWSGNDSLGEAHFLEFGAGWDMLGPLTMYGLGVGKQTLVDITPHLRFELINDALDRLQHRNDQLQKLRGAAPIAFDEGEVRSAADLLAKFAIDYRAPLDAARTGFDAGSIDFISTNSTLEHISEPELPNIIRESFRILKPGGLICHFVDLKDHYSYFDSSITKYNFLRYSVSAWKVFNSPMQYQNRLRFPYYRKLITNNGFEILSEEFDQPSDSELAQLRKLRVHPDFRDQMSEAELAVQIYRVVARKPMD